MKRNLVKVGLTVTILIGIALVIWAFVDGETKTIEDEIIYSDVSKIEEPEIIDLEPVTVAKKESPEVLWMASEMEKQMKTIFSEVDAQRAKEIANLNELKKAEEKRAEEERQRLAKQKQTIAKTQNKPQNLGGGFFNLNLNSITGYDEETFRQMLEGTRLESIAGALVEIENDLEVNGLFLASLAALESGWGESRIARSKNNITGYMAYDNATHMAMRFDSYSHCIKHTAQKLKENYLTPGGRYYNGETLNGVLKRYSSSPTWAHKINKIMIKNLNKIK